MGVSPKDKEERGRKKPGRVPTSCAECRRLKLRCDKNVPCGKCVARGCGSICPDGQLTSGKGNRLVLANTEELHNRIEHLCGRIRDLEEALRTLQESVSDQPHPLLRTDLLHMKAVPPSSPPEEASPASSGSSTLVSDDVPDPSQARTEEENFVDAFGTLTIGVRGEASFLGQTARSEYLFHALTKVPSTPMSVPPRLSRRIVELSFPDLDVPDDDEVGREIFEMLPPLSEAIRLCETYLEHGQYLPATIQRTELLDEVLETVYRAGSFETLRSHHALSLLFVVFATAVLLDPKRQPYSVEAQEYYFLSRAALSLASPVRETTLAAIQALIHLAQYLDMSDWEGTGSDVRWIYIGTATRLAHGIGLHLNSCRWSLGDSASERRSRLFWQLFQADSDLSFSLGRPPSMSMQYNDCSYPKDDEVIGANNTKEISYFLWMCKYSVLMHSIMPAAFGAKVPTYKTILELDRKVRDFAVPVHLQPLCSVETPAPVPSRLMQRFLTLASKENTLLSLHRAYFAQALQEKPEDLANHRYIPSVMAAYRSAWRLVRSLVVMWRDAPTMTARVNWGWSSALSAAIVMCILVARAPGSKMTKSSLEELDSLAVLFQDAAASSRFAAHLLTPILVLRRRAHHAVDANRFPGENVCNVSPADLDRLGGKTSLISKVDATLPCAPAAQPQPQPSPPPAYTRPSPFLDVAGTSSGTMHPTIAQDMRSFDLGEPSQFYGSPFSDEEMAGIQFATNDSMFSAPGGGYGYAPPVLQTSGVFAGSGGAGGSPAPMLDATWQSFVEQLGF
ncbi:fungal-specific transcription factor domain-containing protein [Mycena belliarum]|uniref:Fungal-specific transcription factor domain-containing protein n=1 Tax=Mycena belliarum TaxID=1033014 RepID=A0AAD6TZX4_9AGAR|nr:fungal-specific transcription factor domain-containing protein [Mycena belliae]